MSIDVRPFAAPSRRQMLGRMCTGFGMVGLAGMLGQTAARAATLPAVGRHLAPRAKRVIFLFMNGGPSHIDTFDPKPALEKYAGTGAEGKRIAFLHPSSTSGVLVELTED